nr:MAG TPA: hypothetical protein [Bacteriophage sp.]
MGRDYLLSFKEMLSYFRGNCESHTNRTYLGYLMYSILL